MHVVHTVSPNQMLTFAFVKFNITCTVLVKKVCCQISETTYISRPAGTTEDAEVIQENFKTL